MRQERHLNLELEPEIVAAYAATFISRRDMYPIQLENGTYVSVPKPLTDKLLAAHLKGYLTLGAYALDKNGWAKWICFDADEDRHWHRLVRMAHKLSKVDVVPYFEPSRRGGHLWLFTNPIPGFQIRRFAKQLLSEHKFPELNSKRSGIEIYPKQDRPTTGPGSLVRLPLGIHRLTGKRYHFIALDGTPLAPTIREQLAILANPIRVSQTFIDQVLERAPAHKNISPTPRFNLKPDTGGSVSEHIKNRISVYDFVSQYVELDSQGRGYCPFHDDQHKSFGVNQDGNFWNCFAGCGGGSIIDFWMRWREKHRKKADFKSAVWDLAKMLL